ncbi:lymphocyte antigen 6K-like [Sapajus apella]|nr:lymphocyte antigen 6K-like [Sapajus apella]
MPFFYLKCCKVRYCNLNGPSVNLSVFKDYVESSSKRSCGRLGLTALLLLASTAAGLSLP